MSSVFEKHGDDKLSHRSYSRLYSKYLHRPVKEQIHLSMLEIGVGCVNEFSYGGGAGSYSEGRSVKVWKELLPQAKITVADIDKCALNIAKAGLLKPSEIFVGSQADIPFLDSILEKRGNFDFIIDDASHVAAHQIATFVHLFVHGLRPGGIYVMEDVYFTDIWNENSASYMLAEASLGLTVKGVVVQAYGEFNLSDIKAIQYPFIEDIIPLIDSVDWFEDAMVITKKLS
jgi:hypothetical protein